MYIICFCQTFVVGDITVRIFPLFGVVFDVLFPQTSCEQLRFLCNGRPPVVPSEPKTKQEIRESDWWTLNKDL